MAMKRNSVKIGVIGCGHVAQCWHLPTLRHIADVEVVALSDIDDRLLGQVADRFQVQNRYTDYLELLSDTSIEAVAVCVPAGYHHEVAITSLDAGKHLLMEKPLALELDECDEVIERAGKCPQVVMVALTCGGTVSFKRR